MKTTVFPPFRRAAPCQTPHGHWPAPKMRISRETTQILTIPPFSISSPRARNLTIPPFFSRSPPRERASRRFATPSGCKACSGRSKAQDRTRSPAGLDNAKNANRRQMNVRVTLHRSRALRPAARLPRRRDVGAPVRPVAPPALPEGVRTSRRPTSAPSPPPELLVGNDGEQRHDRQTRCVEVSP